ncbi:blast:Probable G-protein coupled receptor Mth-like 10 [Drosophila guanche]|uniref:Blast:Probable G-protein coupled receptor Mth-like 10 n=1 Tax=Drosophila guanche TaxID=7266 RepID=A0A3B0KES6_DROGU|nr:blast:Probable G-protein coupled receptor Mth-like 10 [Drosophila guanche]
MDNPQTVIINQIIIQSKDTTNLRTSLAEYLSNIMPKQVHQRGGSLYCGLTLMGVVCLVVFRLLPGMSFGVYAMSDEQNIYHIRDGLHVPCTFFDTVNLTGYTPFPNGSYSYEGVLIPSHLVGQYNYIYRDLVERVDVDWHPRGCICRLKACLNICCPWGQVYNSDKAQCINDTTDTRIWPEPVMNVTFDNSSTQPVNIFKQFAVQSFRPCPKMFSLQPEINEFDEYLLFQNGSMLRLDDHLYINKSEFCLVVSYVNQTDLYYSLNPANCDGDGEQTTVKIINAYAMLFSVPFMMLTIAVYLLIPELRNQHGKSLVCYLIGLASGYTALCCILLMKNLDPEGVSCKVIGYTAYFCFMSAFFWLNVISFDLWHNFRGTRGINRFQEKKRFLFYSLYSWGAASMFLVFTWIAQEHTDWPSHLKPGIGAGEYCWLDMRNWSGMIYFFTPILAIIVANTVMFVMTSVKIHGVQREMARIIAREDSTKNLRTEKDNARRVLLRLRFGLFLRLFIIMGVTWSSEIISYFVGNDKKWSKIFYISDLCNAMQGFLIFMLFVMKKKVKHLITNRTIRVRSLRQTETNTTMAGSNFSVRQRFLDASSHIRRLVVIRNAFANATSTASGVHSHAV